MKEKEPESPHEETTPDESLEEKRGRLLDDASAPEPPPKKRGRPRGTQRKKTFDIKDAINEDQVTGWSAITENFTTMLGMLIVVFWKNMPLNDYEKIAHTRAWAVYLTVCPPETLEDLAKLNLALVYILIFTPRIGYTVKEKFFQRGSHGLKQSPPESTDKPIESISAGNVGTGPKSPKNKPGKKSGL